jgi:hypothetical protein
MLGGSATYALYLKYGLAVVKIPGATPAVVGRESGLDDEYDTVTYD